MLSSEERTKLARFVNRGLSGTPFLRRAQIILLADEGATQEQIAAEVQVPITRVRQMLRAYKKEGPALFPDAIWSGGLFEADDTIGDAARLIIADLVNTLRQYEADLSTATSVTAVHESRKTTRKMRTALRLFDPYFEAGLLRSYRKRARKFMRRLGRSRDTAVFLLKLEAFISEGHAEGALSTNEQQALSQLAEYWRHQQAQADEGVRRYLAGGKYQRLLADLNAFGRGDVGQATLPEEQGPRKVRHIAPVMIYDKLASVRATDDQLANLQPERLHILRIRCKELRYALEFFEGVLGPSAGDCIDSVKRVLIHLGDVNDARVHLKMLGQMSESALDGTAVSYRGVVDEQLRSLRQGFPAVWSEFDRLQWREDLALSVAVL